LGRDCIVSKSIVCDGYKKNEEKQKEDEPSKTQRKVRKCAVVGLK
jgi:hypothetical protein